MIHSSLPQLAYLTIEILASVATGTMRQRRHRYRSRAFAGLRTTDVPQIPSRTEMRLGLINVRKTYDPPLPVATRRISALISQ